MAGYEASRDRSHVVATAEASCGPARRGDRAGRLPSMAGSMAPVATRALQLFSPRMPNFARFDQRHYRTVTAQQGYGAWQPTYESTVQDVMDLALLDRIKTIDWAGASDVAD